MPVLSDAVSDGEPLVRGHAAWALGRIASGSESTAEVAAHVGEVLVARLLVEDDAWVREEISLALAG